MADLYGFSHAVGLPGFEGTVRERCSGEMEARYLGALAATSLTSFKAQHRWEHPSSLGWVESALRAAATYASPRPVDRQGRLEVVTRLRRLAQSGIHFCSGLDLHPYGSFCSGLYTPAGDLDLSIEGTATWVEGRTMVQIPISLMDSEMQVQFLKALCKRLRATGAQKVQPILGARVPIIKFVDAVSGLDCDIAVGSSGAVFKSAVMGLLAQHEWRFGALVRLVKLWARDKGANDPANGTLNSFALTLMVLFFLQTRTPRVLPPLSELFLHPGQSPADTALRPMHQGAEPPMSLLAGAATRLSQLSQRPVTERNSETLLELLSAFFALYKGIFLGWVDKGPTLGHLLRAVRVDTWTGTLRHEPWQRPTAPFCAVEDPFDATDNCARTVREAHRARLIADSFYRAAQNMAQPTSLQLQGAHGLEAVLGRQVWAACGGAQVLASAIPPYYDSIAPATVWFPPELNHMLASLLPPTASVTHLQRRGLRVTPPGGAGAAGEDAGDGMVAALAGLSVVEVVDGQEGEEWESSVPMELQEKMQAIQMVLQREAELKAQEWAQKKLAQRKKREEKKAEKKAAAAAAAKAAAAVAKAAETKVAALIAAALEPAGIGNGDDITNDAGAAMGNGAPLARADVVEPFMPDLATPGAPTAMAGPSMLPISTTAEQTRRGAPTVTAASGAGLMRALRGRRGSRGGRGRGRGRGQPAGLESVGHVTLAAEVQRPWPDPAPYVAPPPPPPPPAAAASAGGGGGAVDAATHGPAAAAPGGAVVAPERSRGRRRRRPQSSGDRGRGGRQGGV